MAAPKIQVYVEGVELWRQAVKAIPQVVRKQLAIAVHETVQMVRQSAMSRAPSDRGDLRANVVITGRPTSLTQRVGPRDVDLPSRGGKNSFHRNPGVYGIQGVEYATKHTRAQPWLKPALEAAGPWYLAALNRRRSAIEAELARFNRGGGA